MSALEQHVCSTATDTPKSFRQHTHIVSTGRSQALNALNEEWVEINIAAATRVQMRQWKRHEPCLAFSSLGELVDAIDDAPTAATNEYLRALVRLFQSGQQLAGRVLLQMFLPKLEQIRHYARISHELDMADDEQLAQTFANFWEILLTYTPEKVTTLRPSHIMLDTLHAITVGQGRMGDPSPHIITTLAGDRTPDDVVEDVYDELSPDVDLDYVLTWALGRKLITPADYELIADVYMGEGSKREYKAAAEARGITEANARQRCSRITRSIAEAAKAEVLISKRDPSRRH